MNVQQIYLNNLLRNFNYILYSENSSEAIIFDPYDGKIIAKELEKRGTLKSYLVNTHSHFDHVKGNSKVLKIEHCKKIELQNGQRLAISDTEYIKCVYTPGHVMDHKCYFLYEKDKLTGIIAGDMIFNAGVGNCKNGGDPEVLYKTMKDVFLPLSGEIKIYPSHDYFLSNLKFAKSMFDENIIDQYIDKVKALKKGEFLITTIEQEKKYNPFFRCFDKDYQDKFNMNEKDLFIHLRGKRDKW